ncbi:hypothetical protein CIP107518_01549 [Corynebacterium diphtheriae]|nr:hypothetical protein CIP107518_01549 [Corynebacterium diphtheriae]
MTSMTREEIEKLVAKARAENKTPNLRGANLQGADLRGCKWDGPLEDLKPQGGDA